MPRSHLLAHRWRALVTLLAFAVFVSLMFAVAGAQNARPRGRSQPPQNSIAGINSQQARRKSIASVRSVDTSDGSRVTITSDVPLNDYEAYWGGDRFFVIIPNADVTSQSLQSLQTSLRGQGFQDVRIERKGNDLVFSFRLQPGMRAHPDQKFNRLDVIFTAPAGVTFNANQNTGNSRTSQRNTTGNRQGNTSVTNTTVTSANSSRASSGGTTASTDGGGGGARAGRSSRGSRGYNYGGGGGGDRGGGVPLNIPLPSDTTPEASPSASPSASPFASPSVGEGTTQTSASPEGSPSSSPEQIAQNVPQQPVTAPPQNPSTTTTSPAPATGETSFAAAVQENWLPLLIGLLVLLAIGLLLVSRSRASAGEEAAERVETRKLETIKEKPASKTGAALAGGAAGAATAAALAKESSAKAAPVTQPVEKEEVKEIEPVVPAAGMEQVSTEVKGLLEGKGYDEAVVGSSNPETRQIVSTELMAALASRNPERRQRAREAFTKHGFFDEATQRLRTGASPAERISAARALGLTQDHAATAHLTTALEDDDPEVRRAAVNALAELRDPSAIGPLNALLEREKNRKVPHSLIRRAIESSATIDVVETPAASAAAPAVEAKGETASTAEKKDKDDEDREVFEI